MAKQKARKKQQEQVVEEIVTSAVALMDAPEPTPVEARPEDQFKIRTKWGPLGRFAQHHGGRDVVSRDAVEALRLDVRRCVREGALVPLGNCPEVADVPVSLETTVADALALAGEDPAKRADALLAIGLSPIPVVGHGHNAVLDYCLKRLTEEPTPEAAMAVARRIERCVGTDVNKLLDTLVTLVSAVGADALAEKLTPIVFPLALRDSIVKDKVLPWIRPITAEAFGFLLSEASTGSTVAARTLFHSLYAEIDQ